MITIELSLLLLHNRPIDTGRPTGITESDTPTRAAPFPAPGRCAQRHLKGARSARRGRHCAADCADATHLLSARVALAGLFIRRHYAPRAFFAAAAASSARLLLFIQLIAKRNAPFALGITSAPICVSMRFIC